MRAKRRFTMRRPIDGVFNEVPRNPGVFSNGKISIRIEIDPDIRSLEIASVNENLRRLGDKQVELYKPLVMDRVANRFAELEEAKEWFATGRVPGYGDRTQNNWYAPVT